MLYYRRQNFETAVEYLPQAIELAENEFLRRARWIEIYTEIETLTGPEMVPFLRGRFARLDHQNSPNYVAHLHPVSYQAPTLELDQEQSCSVSIAQSIQSETLPVASTQSLTFTQVFSQATGTAMLNLTNGNLFLSLSELPQPEKTPYEVKVTFWPNKTDSVGYVQPDGNQEVQVNLQLEERSSAPIEYYYSLGLAFAYLEPPVCDKAIPWLLKALELDSSAYNPAWAGLRICPSPDSPPTPIPTPTPLPEEEE